MEEERKEKVLAVSQDETLTGSFADELGENGYRMILATTGRQGLECFDEENPEIVLLGTDLPDMDCQRFLRQLRGRGEDPAVVILGSSASMEVVREALREGALDYVAQPFSRERLLLTLRRVGGELASRKEARKLRQELCRLYGFESIVGQSRGMQRAREVASRCIDSEAPVLIEGERGTGKELMARVIHYNGQCRNGPFVCLDLGVLSGEMGERELFGCAKGARPGVLVGKSGVLQEAKGGTLFLERVDGLSPSIQVKLARVLRIREVLPVGGKEPVPVSARLIAVCDPGLEEKVRRGSFREDLFYSLSAATVHLPPLRERREDVVLLAYHFLRISNPKHGKEILGFSSGAIRKLMDYDWPGNVRELETRVTEAATLSNKTVLGADDLLFAGKVAPHDWLPFREAKAEVVGDFEKRYLDALLRRTRGNVTRAARESGKDRSALQKLMRKHGLKSKNYRLSSCK